MSESKSSLSLFPFPATHEEYRRWRDENAPEGVRYFDCFCGCGQPAPIARETKPSRKRFRGEPMRYIQGHEIDRVDLSDPSCYETKDTGYETPCKLWTRAVGPNGYGYVRIDGKTRSVHRFLYQEKRGPLPQSVHLHHLCGVRRCVELAHIAPISRSEHTRHHAVGGGKYTKGSYSSRYKGVSWAADKGKWLAQMHINGRGKFIGYFSVAAEAARAYDRAAFGVWGEAAYLNFPDELNEPSKPDAI